MEVKEIKHGDIHCFSNCGFNCKAAVLEKVTRYYGLLLKEVGDGWRVRTWHSNGWNAELVHDLSGFSLVDLKIRTNQKSVFVADVLPESRFHCYKYDGDKTVPIRAWGQLLPRLLILL